MIVRNAVESDLEQIFALGISCFPAEEAASKEVLAERIQTFPEHFWILEEKGVIISCAEGMTTDTPMPRDEMYKDASIHEETGEWQILFDIMTMPKLQGHGCATVLLKKVISDVRKQKRKGIVLTCKQSMIPFYQKLGFINEGKSMSKRGGAVWYDMRLSMVEFS